MHINARLSKLEAGAPADSPRCTRCQAVLPPEPQQEPLPPPEVLRAMSNLQLIRFYHDRILRAPQWTCNRCGNWHRSPDSLTVAQILEAGPEKLADLYREQLRLIEQHGRKMFGLPEEQHQDQGDQGEQAEAERPLPKRNLFED